MTSQQVGWSGGEMVLQGVLLNWMVVRQGPIARMMVVGHFSVVFLFSVLSPFLEDSPI